MLQLSLSLSLSLSLPLPPSLFLSNDGSSCHAVADVTRCHDSQHSSVTLRRRVLALCVCVCACVCVCMRVCVVHLFPPLLWLCPEHVFLSLFFVSCVLKNTQTEMSKLPLKGQTSNPQTNHWSLLKGNMFSHPFP